MHAFAHALLDVGREAGIRDPLFLYLPPRYPFPFGFTLKERKHHSIDASNGNNDGVCFHCDYPAEVIET